LYNSKTALEYISCCAYVAFYDYQDIPFTHITNLFVATLWEYILKLTSASQCCKFAIMLILVVE